MMKGFHDALRKDIEKILLQALAEKVTPGAAVAVSYIDSESYRRNLFVHAGYTRYGKKREKVTETTLYDLASLTKPLVTFLSLLSLIEEGVITLETPLQELILSIKVPEEKKDIRLWQLMSHCSGLPAYRPFFIDSLGLPSEKRKKYILSCILGEKLEFPPGTRHVYSDLGYMLLGEAIEQYTGQSLDSYYTNLLPRLGLSQSLQFRPADRESNEECVSTEQCPWTLKLLRGVVHDDNCRIMGGVAGHAGLFGTAQDVLDVCLLIGDVWRGESTTNFFSRDLLQQLLTRRANSTWTCGFDTPSPVSSSGVYFKPSSVGHLGFTGTSMWLDLEQNIAVVLLTNRVHPSRNNIKIKILRPQLHDLIMKKIVEDKDK